MIDKFDRYMLSVIGAVMLLLGGLVIYGDHVGVTVLGITPADGSVVAVTTDIRIEFDQVMDQDSVEEGFTLVPAVAGELLWRGGDTLIFRPSEPFSPGQRYEVRINDDVRSITGRRLKERLRWTFTTQVVTVYYLSPAQESLQGLWAINTDGSNPHPVFTPETGVFSYSVSPYGRQVAVTVLTENAAAAEIWLISADGSNVRQLTNCAPGVCGQAAWSPNEDVLAYAKQTPNEIGSLSPSRVWLWNLTTNETAALFEDSQVLGYYPIWSPDGNWLTFYDSNDTAIRMINFSTGEIRLVETQLPERWSFDPTSQQLAYSDLRGDDGWYYPQLIGLNLTNGGEREPILENPEQDQEPLYSPNGKWIVFRRRLVDGGSNGSQLMLYNVKDKTLREITTDPDYTNSNVQWGPYSNQLIFQRYLLRTAEFVPEIWLYDLETEELRLLVTNAANGQWGVG